MNKKIIISVSISLVVIIGIILTIVLLNNRVYSTIILDINPSIKINLTKDNKVMSIIPLNEDAKSIINNDLVGKSLDETFNIISGKLIENDYVIDNEITMLIYTEGNIRVNEVEKLISSSFEDTDVRVENIVVNNISKEDRNFAKENNISPVKAAFIKSINNENIKDTDLINKSVKELDDMKITGNYCDTGYTLNNNECLKEISRDAAKTGNVCPLGYYDYLGKCYEEVGIEETGNYYCNSDYTLKNEKCTKTITIEAEKDYYCEKGELLKKGDVNPIGSPDNDTYYCIDKSTGKVPVLRCLNNKGHIMINGKCYNGPAPTINGGCPNGDTLRNGKCYSLDSYDQYECPNGNIYEKSKDTFIELCPDTFTYIKPVIKGYFCKDEYELMNNKCVKEDVIDAFPERKCPSNYTLVNNDKCINYNKTTSKENGYYCLDDRARLNGNECIIYDIKEANHSN